jgi:hypothetical protein
MAESENHLIAQLGLFLRISSGLFWRSSIWRVLLQTRCQWTVRQASMVQTSRPAIRIGWGL